MKRIILILSVCIMFLCNCVKNTERETITKIPQRAKINLLLKGQNETKSTNTNWADNEIKKIQIYVFNQDKTLDVSEQKTSLEDISLYCESGNGKSIYVIANYNKLIEVNNENQLLSLYSSLRDNSLGSFVMIGRLTGVNIENGQSYTINIKRQAVKISIDKISNNIKDSYLQTKTFTIKAIYLINAVEGNLNFFASSYTTQLWLNKQTHIHDNQLSAMTYDLVERNLGKGESYNTKHSFYCYPNYVSTDAHQGTWTARKTRLVVEVQIAGQSYYYPITLDRLESNKHYHFSSLNITRKGSDNPDTELSSEHANFNIHIEDWEENQMGSVTL